MKVPPPITSGTSLEGVVTIQPPIVSGVEKGLPSGKVVGDAKQVVGDAKQVVRNAESVPALTSSVAQDPGAT